MTTNSRITPAHAFAVALLLAPLCGCDRNQGTAAPAAATPPAAPAPADTEMYVEAPPPLLQSEVMVASPGPGFIWVSGYWGWRAGNHAWVHGHWERPPHPHSTWVQPRWEHRGRGYVFIRGYWH